MLQREFNHLLDTKPRLHGFDGYEDTCRMFDRQFAQLQHDRTNSCMRASA